MTKTVTISELAQSLQVHPRTINRWVTAGDFPAPLRLPGRVKRWAVDDVLAAIGADGDGTEARTLQPA